MPARQMVSGVLRNLLPLGAPGGYMSKAIRLPTRLEANSNVAVPRPDASVTTLPR